MRFYKKTVRDIELGGHTVLLRADYNVPLTEEGKIADDYRITSSLATIKYLQQQNCRIVICSHLGRPDGKVNAKESLEPVATRLAELLGQHVAFVSESIGDQVIQAVKNLPKGQILLLENLRFHGGEEKNDRLFAQALAHDSGARYFVQDGFGVVHRAHASTSAVTEFLPSVAGLLLEKEVTTITGVMKDPERPMVAILGGAKISDKIKVIERFVTLADTVVIGGAMANTFLQYRGFPIGKSVHEDGLESIMKSIYGTAARKVEDVDGFLVLPIDVAVAAEISDSTRRMVVSRNDVRSSEYILDVGPDSIQRIASIIADAKTIVWNGTMGMAEKEKFSYGSARTALAIAQNEDATSVIGGGDTADFVLKWDVSGGASFTHVSTGGGASLELMASEPMPGIDSLLDA
jgi:phosphoglycerate kinase